MPMRLGPREALPQPHMNSFVVGDDEQSPVAA
jgi:hypothetical protein